MKILVLGLAKSGTSILTYRIFDAVPGWRKKLHFEVGLNQGAEDIRFHRKATFSLRSVVSKNLVYPDQHTNWSNIYQVANYYGRCVWIARDPRDIVISNFFYHWYRHHGATEEQYLQALDLTKRKEKAPASLPFFRLVAGTMTPDAEHLRQWQMSYYDQLVSQADAISRHCFVLRYEDMIEEKLDDLHRYLGFNISRDSTLPKQSHPIARTRTYDNWRQWFTDEDVAFFRPLFSKYLSAMGYDPDDWILSVPEQLDAAEGSVYMKSLRDEN